MKGFGAKRGPRDITNADHSKVYRVASLDDAVDFIRGENI